MKPKTPEELRANVKENAKAYKGPIAQLAFERGAAFVLFDYTALHERRQRADAALTEILNQPMLNASYADTCSKMKSIAQSFLNPEQ